MIPLHRGFEMTFLIAHELRETRVLDRDLCCNLAS